MYKISVSKELFSQIQQKKLNILEKTTSSYWKRELLEPKIVNDKIKYSIKQLDKIKITNGLGEDKPQMIIECIKIDYSFKKDLFEFYLGNIIEQKNSNLDTNYKDTLIQELLREKAMLEESLNKDHLTGVYNRRKMQNDLSMFINQNNKDLLAAVFVNIDRFKNINNTFGYDSGDKVLCYVAKKLQNHCKNLNAEAYRLDNVEFVLFCFLPKQELVEKLFELKQDIKSQKTYHSKGDIQVSASMGVSFFKDCKTPNDLLIKAKQAVNEAKNKGRDKIVIS